MEVITTHLKKSSIPSMNIVLRRVQPLSSFAKHERELKGKNYCKAVFGVVKCEAGIEEGGEGIESAIDSAK